MEAYRRYSHSLDSWQDGGVYDLIFSGTTIRITIAVGVSVSGLESAISSALPTGFTLIETTEQVNGFGARMVVIQTPFSEHIVNIEVIDTDGDLNPEGHDTESFINGSVSPSTDIVSVTWTGNVSGLIGAGVTISETDFLPFSESVADDFLTIDVVSSDSSCSKSLRFDF